jgi:hypothetical protein
LKPLEVLRNSSFGKRTAEEEREQLRAYFVETEQWRQVFDGEIDIVYGPKGSGKSAIYSLISQNANAFFDRDIIIVTGENPQGTPAFKDIRDDPPNNEFEFVSLWKVYILTLCGQAIRDYGLSGPKCDILLSALQEADLIPSSFSLGKALRYAFDYVRRFTRPQALETSVSLDPITGVPTSLRGRIVFSEPSAAAAKRGIVSIDELFATASEALSEAGYTIWVVLDRLDVAFAGKEELEASALRALFKFYLDTKGHRNISTKIFLRTDIWANITRSGFREASHIERALTIQWNTEDLTNLVVRRAISNEAICEFYKVDRNDILANYASQEEFLARILPDQVETGPNKPKTFQWMLGRTRDATQVTAPRELIHFLNELRNVQINRMELGDAHLSGEKLFEQAAFKEALPAVSKVRLEQTLFAEFSALQPYMEAMHEQKATQPLSSLQTIWGVSAEEARKLAAQLEQIGFFEKLSGQQGTSWRVPFLYRPALNLVQGVADASE